MSFKVTSHASIKIEVDLGDGFIVDNKVGTRIWATRLSGRIDASGSSHFTARGEALKADGMRGKRPAVCYALNLSDLPTNLQSAIIGAYDRAVSGLVSAGTPMVHFGDES